MELTKTEGAQADLCFHGSTCKWRQDLATCENRT